MRKLTYYVACTVDRFIARQDGSFDCFLMEGEHFDDLIRDFPDTIPGHLRAAFKVEDGNKRFDTVLMGRSTYEVGLKEGVTSPYPHLRQYVFSRTMTKEPHSEVCLVSGEALDVVRKLKNEAGLDIWLCGGGKLASSLSSEIDELILKVNPVVIGAGIPMFDSTIEPRRVFLNDFRAYGSGFAIMHYDVKRRAQL